jgi:hypothetical protein
MAAQQPIYLAGRFVSPFSAHRRISFINIASPLADAMTITLKNY